MNIIEYPDRSKWDELLKRPIIEWDDIESRVAPILKEVKANGDSAVKRFTEDFDNVTVDVLKVTAEEIAAAEDEVSDELKNAIQVAWDNIAKFHSSQEQEAEKVETAPGVICWRKSVAIERVGLYIPGGTAPLFSTLLMLAIPARIAGCEKIVVCTPPDKDGDINPVILYVASLFAKVEVYKVGGAQAIAAMAYGTETIPNVYKIFGPGNQFVTAAKQLVSKEGVAIDMPAGPSEVCVVADKTADPDFIAADLLSQAEHGADSQVILITTEKELIEKVQISLKDQLDALPRKEMAKHALNNSTSFLVKDIEEAMALSNAYAPEHLILQLENVYDAADMVINAGSVFLGNFTPESAGDYASGTNHTLPTNGYARAYSGVSLDSYVKKITFQKISKEGIELLGDAIEIMADAEGLEAHRNAVDIRREGL